MKVCVRCAADRRMDLRLRSSESTATRVRVLPWSAATARRRVCCLAATCLAGAFVMGALPAYASRSAEPGVDLQRVALMAEPKDRPPTRGVLRRGLSRPSVRPAFHVTYFVPGNSHCPTVFPSGASLSQIAVTAPLLYAPYDEWYWYYNGIATSGAGWQVLWEGPYWVEAPLWDRVYNAQFEPLSVTEGGGGSTFTIYRDDALGVHWIVDWQTDQAFTSWTYALQDGGRGYCEDYAGLFSAGASVHARATHAVGRRSAERHLARYVAQTRRSLENRDDPIVPGATTTVTWHSSGCVPRRTSRRHRHAIACGYELGVVVEPNPGSSVEFRALRCGDARVLVKLRSKRSRRLRVVKDKFRCRRDQASVQAPPGAPEQPVVNPPPPPATGPPPQPAAGISAGG
jgi:hypothetical protein